MTLLDNWHGRSADPDVTAAMHAAAREQAAQAAARAMERDLAWAQHVADALLLLDDDAPPVPCELWNRIPGLDIRYARCGNYASWVMHVTYPCGHHGPEARMVCGPCKQQLDADGYDIGCGVTTQSLCGATKAEIRWMERSR